MAEQGLSSRYNLLTLANLSHNEKTIREAEVLTENNPILYDANVITASGKYSHTGTRQTSLPTPQIIKIGEYYSSSVAQWAKFSDDMSTFVDAIEIPERVQRKEGAEKVAALERSHKEGFSQGVANHLCYGTSVANPEKFDGFDVRYYTPDLNNPLNPTSSGDINVFDAGGTGSDTMSILFVQWSAMKTSLIVPEDETFGIDMIDRGLIDRVDPNNATKHQSFFVTDMFWELGLTIEDQRGVARVRNIESSVDNISATLKKLIYQVRQECFKGKETIWMYVPRRMATHFDIMAEAKMNVKYDKENPYEVMMMRWGDMPIRTCECLKIDETAVAAA